MEFDNTNRGVLFKNDKQGVETRPDYNGKININGVEHWLAAWVKTSQKGTPFMSLSIGNAFFISISYSSLSYLKD